MITFRGLCEGGELATLGPVEFAAVDNHSPNSLVRDISRMDRLQLRLLTLPAPPIHLVAE
jgi:hypothetical protein